VGDLRSDDGRGQETRAEPGSSRQEEPAEERLLKELERLTGESRLWPGRADVMYEDVWGRGATSALLRGFSRELRDTLAQWGRLRERRKYEGVGVRG
jgi:hypothetical protein